MESTIHEPVLLDEVVEFLRAKEGGMYLDCTLGGGGHTDALLKANDKNYVIALDRDPQAIARAQNKFLGHERLTIVQGKFSDVERICKGQIFSGILADLGMSTDQLEADRGFSFSDTNSFDMRMNPEEFLTAEYVVNNYDQGKLFKIFRQGGVGPEARRYANAIVAARPVESARQLAGIIAGCTSEFSSNHPATVVFQAIRIEVNSEFSEIENLLEAAPRLVASNSRFAVICFHSIEDELITKKFRKWAGSEAAPAWMGRRDSSVKGKLITKKAVTPTEAEKQRNPASRSARLRVFEFDA